MSDSERAALSDAEREVLFVLWDHGPEPVREVQRLLAGQGQDWARSTVITLLQRLEKKGYVESDRSQSTFVFHPIVSRKEVMHDRMVNLAEEMCEGDALPLLLAFAEQHRFSAEEIDRFRDMIDRLQPKRKKRGSR